MIYQISKTQNKTGSVIPSLPAEFKGVRPSRSLVIVQTKYFMFNVT